MKKASSIKLKQYLPLAAGMLCILAATGAAAAPVAAPNTIGLSISVYREGKPLDCVVLDQSTFELSFIHSVSLTPVTDYYTVVQSSKGFQIVQTAETFFAHGQGLPSLVNEPDATDFRIENGQFVLTMSRLIEQLIVRTDVRFENRLHTRSETTNLNRWPDNGLLLKPVSSCPK
ncbi:MAG: DUF1850 domain-containing protein [Marinobacter sp.]